MQYRPNHLILLNQKFSLYGEMRKMSVCAIIVNFSIFLLIIENNSKQGASFLFEELFNSIYFFKFIKCTQSKLNQIVILSTSSY